MFRIKVCGVTVVEDVRMLAAAGVDAVGFNFYPRSVRAIDERRAAELAAVLPPGVARVGVFVNATADQIERIARLTPLDYVQLHGDESPEFAAELAGTFPVIRAIRCRFDEVARPLQWLDEFQRLGGRLAALLVDAAHDGQYGGTGAKADWRVIEPFRQAAAGTPLILAGGLRPENVAEAIAAVRPDGVDTASGVESQPGRKDPDLTARFVENARRAFLAG